MIVAWLPCENSMRCSNLVMYPDLRLVTQKGPIVVSFPYTSVLGVWRAEERVR